MKGIINHDIIDLSNAEWKLLKSKISTSKRGGKVKLLKPLQKKAYICLQQY